MRKEKILTMGILVIVGMMLLMACGQTASEDIAPTCVSTPSPTNTPIPSMTEMPSPTDSLPVTEIPTSTPIPSPTEWPSPTSTPTPSPTNTPIPFVTELPTSTPTPSLTNILTPTEFPSPMIGVSLNEEIFPDEMFREFLASYIDRDKDGILTEEERSSLVSLNSSGYCFAEEVSLEERRNIRKIFAEISSFKGAECFESLNRVQIKSKKIEVLSLDNPKLEYLAVENENLKDFTLKNAGNLKYFRIWLNGEAQRIDIDWNSIRKLEYLNVRGLSVDIGAVAQNESLEILHVGQCSITWPQSILSFSLLKNLEIFGIYDLDAGDECWVDTLDFGQSKKLDTVEIPAGTVRQVVVASPEVQVESKGVSAQRARCKIIFQNELDAEIPSVVDEGSVILSEENFPDVYFRQYLHRYADTNHDCILSKEERNAVTRIRDRYIDYTKTTGWHDANADLEIEEERMYQCVSSISNLQGIEYFPNLYELMLWHFRPQEEISELVFTNPNLEILHLSFKAPMGKVDLSACEKLRICVIGGVEDSELTILTPKHLVVEPWEGWDCAIGEEARTILSW